MARVLIVHDDVDVGMFTSMQLGDGLAAGQTAAHLAAATTTVTLASG
jgi:hypothetical protein